MITPPIVKEFNRRTVENVGIYFMLGKKVGSNRSLKGEIGN